LNAPSLIVAALRGDETRRDDEHDSGDGARALASDLTTTAGASTTARDAPSDTRRDAGEGTLDGGTDDGGDIDDAEDGDGAPAPAGDLAAATGTSTASGVPSRATVNDAGVWSSSGSTMTTGPRCRRIGSCRPPRADDDALTGGGKRNETSPSSYSPDGDSSGKMLPRLLIAAVNGSREHSHATAEKRQRRKTTKTVGARQTYPGHGTILLDTRIGAI
jgi:hypothetical protein